MAHDIKCVEHLDWQTTRSTVLSYIIYKCDGAGIAAQSGWRVAAYWTWRAHITLTEIWSVCRQEQQRHMSDTDATQESIQSAACTAAGQLTAPCECNGHFVSASRGTDKGMKTGEDVRASAEWCAVCCANKGSDVLAHWLLVHFSTSGKLLRRMNGRWEDYIAMKLGKQNSRCCYGLNFLSGVDWRYFTNKEITIPKIILNREATVSS